MQSTRRPQRLARMTISMMVIFGIAVAQPLPVGADEKLGETAIDNALNPPSADEPVEEEAPPPEQTQDAAPPAETSEATEQAPPANTGDASQVAGALDAGTGVAADSVALAQQVAAPADSAAATDSGGGDNQTSGDSGGNNQTSSAQQTVEQPAQGTSGNSGGNDSSANDAPEGVAENAISNVMLGDPALTVDPALQAAAPILGGTDPDDGSGSGSGANDGGLREETSEQAADLRAAGNSLRPESHRRADGEPRQDEGGTVVVNSLGDSGDEGQIAQHGHIIGGTLCDGSQFWSLDGGGTINANGVNLSANGGTTLADATGGDDNVAGNGGAAGNGGSAGASAEGGIVVVDSLVTGNNTGNQVSLNGQSFDGDCGSGVVDGGDVTTISNVNISADGGTALADASGGDDNIAGNGGAAGNGGTARASADGGIVLVGDLVLGNNEGNEVNVSGGSGAGGSGSGGCLVDGGSVRNEANIDISADGGIAAADASGGDDNAAFGEDAAAGNGGRARANADGGVILAGDITTGNNRGNTIDARCGGAGSGSGSTQIYGGDVVNETNLTLSADGGVAFADAAGGDDNIAVGGNGDEVAAGNGGRARADASGGVIWVEDIVTGNNVGHVIAFGAANLAPVPDSDDKDDKKERRIRTIKPTFAAPSKDGARTAPKRVSRSQSAGRSTVAVGKLPDTGTGSTLVGGSQATTAVVLAGIALIGIAAAAQVVSGGRPAFASLPGRASRSVLRR